MKRRLGITAAAVLTAACLMIIDSRYSLETTGYSLSFSSLPAEFNGFRIVLLSDLHGMRFGKGNRRLAAAVLRCRPDLIVLGGDMLADSGELRPLEELLQGIEVAAPVYSVSGNHEWYANCVPEANELMRSYGVRCLSNGFEPLYCGSGRIIVCGVEDRNGPAGMIKPEALAAELRREYPNDFVLWLSHRNDSLELHPTLPVELVLSGHAHGGVIRLPFIGGLLSVHHRFGADYEKGAYNEGGPTMLVSRGLGNSIAVPRIFNRPEIVCLTPKSLS